jgi:hypothetical protein
MSGGIPVIISPALSPVCYSRNFHGNSEPSAAREAITLACATHFPEPAVSRSGIILLHGGDGGGTWTRHPPGKKIKDDWSIK